MNETTKEFGKSINRLIAGGSLSREETHCCFAQILNGGQPEMHEGAFLAAITAKGPSPAEIAGAWQAIYEQDTIRITPETREPLVDNCGTGMDSFKTFNISTCAAVVAAAGGAFMARHGARAITSKCGTVDLCEALGVDVEGPASLVKQSIEDAGIGLFNGMSAAVHPRALFRILSRMRFGSILNIAASLANPAKPCCGVRGVYARGMVEPIAKAMREIGFQRAVVYHGSSGNGSGGIDELSPVAESYVAELTEDGDILAYTVTPAEAGIRNGCTLRDIAGGGDPQTEAKRLLKVFTGADRGAVYETICLNTAPIFYVAGHVRDFQEGAVKARDTIDSGAALNKLRQWVEAQNRTPCAGRRNFETILENI